MLNSLKIFWRNLSKQKTVGVLSIGSLAISIATAVLIGLWAMNEFSFDHFHRDGDKIYRVVGHYMLNNEKASIGATYKPLGQSAKEQFPEIESMCRVVPSGGIEVKLHDVVYPDNQLLMVDSNFFSFFTFALKSGDAKSCLVAPNQLVIDEYTANRYFPGENPIGKSLEFYDKSFTVSAVMYDIPENSHLKGHIVSPFAGYYAQDLKWGSTDAFITYFKVPSATVVEGVNKKITEMVAAAMPVFKDLDFTYCLQPLSDIHFNADLKFDYVVKGNKSLVLVFIFTALVILLIACINFINLFISTSFLRAKAIGVKKTHGAVKWLLIREFYLETFYYVLIAVVVGLMLAVVALPLFNRLADYNLTIDFMSPVLYLFVGLLMVVIMLTAGTFPALYMTKFNAVDTLKGQFKGKNLSFLQKGLIITQFTASIVILISVFFMNKQVDFMISKDLGFDKENVLYVYDRGGFIKGYDAFRSDLMNSPAISDITVKDALPTGWCRGNILKKSGEDRDFLMEFCRIKPNYFDMLGMTIVAGQGFTEEQSDSLHNCILNETAVRMLGFSNPIGEKVYTDGYNFMIQGVVKDAQTKSLHQRTDPQIYFKMGEMNGWNPFLFKVNGNPQEAIRLIETKWNLLNPGTPFEYDFLDDTYAELYKSEVNAGQILTFAMLITLLISVAGLFAMAYYATQRRLKEVGVRKVNGASVGELLLILNCDFFVWVGISFLIACPLAYLFVSRWLDGFTERTVLSWWVFALAGAITFLVTLITVSFQTWKAANVNPVKVLKSE